MGQHKATSEWKVKHFFEVISETESASAFKKIRQPPKGQKSVKHSGDPECGHNSDQGANTRAWHDL